VSLSDFDIRVMLALKNKMVALFPFLFYRIDLEDLVLIILKTLENLNMSVIPFFNG
jgi:predicted membrane-bound mannosyltransferase